MRKPLDAPGAGGGGSGSLELEIDAIETLSTTRLCVPYGIPTFTQSTLTTDGYGKVTSHQKEHMLYLEMVYLCQV